MPAPPRRPGRSPPPPPEATAEEVLAMGEALRLAGQAASAGEVPVGCVILREGRIIAAAANLVETRRDPTAHAEMLAVVEACRVTGDRRLEGCTLVVTLEPCPMCAGAIVAARIPRVVYGADDPKAGAVRSLMHVLTDPRLNHRCVVVPGVMAAEGGGLLTSFFAARRRGRADAPPEAGY